MTLPKNLLELELFWTQHFLDSKCTWEWSLTLALAQLVLFSCPDYGYSKPFQIFQGILDLLCLRCETLPHSFYCECVYENNPLPRYRKIFRDLMLQKTTNNDTRLCKHGEQVHGKLFTKRKKIWSERQLRKWRQPQRKTTLNKEDELNIKDKVKSKDDLQ